MQTLSAGAVSDDRPVGFLAPAPGRFHLQLTRIPEIARDRVALARYPLEAGAVGNDEASIPVTDDSHPLQAAQATDTLGR